MNFVVQFYLRAIGRINFVLWYIAEYILQWYTFSNFIISNIHFWIFTFSCVYFASCLFGSQWYVDITKELLIILMLICWYREGVTHMKVERKFSHTCQGAGIFKREIFTFGNFLKKTLISRSSKMSIFAFLLCNFQNKKTVNARS